MTRLVLSEAKLGDSVILAPGDELVLDLNERASTGYRWLVEQIEPAVLVPRESDDHSQNNAPGAAATRRLVFVALAPGVSELRLKRARGDAVDRRVSIGVTVRR